MYAHVVRLRYTMWRAFRRVFDGKMAALMRIACVLTVFAAAVIAMLHASRSIEAQSLASPTYTAEQAAAGKETYTQSCASCHGPNLDDGEFGPPLKGVEFRQRWGGRSAETL